MIKNYQNYMSRATISAAGADITKFGDSTELSPPRKTDPLAELEVKTGAPPVFRTRDREDPEYWRQREKFLEQYEQSEGYDIELDKFDYDYAPIKFEWGETFDVERSKDELMKLLIKTAIDEENEECETQLEFVKYVSANVLGVQGYCFYITFWAKDVSSPDPEPKLYQAKMWKYRHEIEVIQFRLRPTQERFGSILTLDILVVYKFLHLEDQTQTREPRLCTVQIPTGESQVLMWEPHFDPHQSKEELLRLLTQTENGTEVEFVEHVKANARPCAGMMYFITFRAKDVSSQDPEPKLYQAQVQKFCDEISVHLMRLRPTQD
ncbi:unnamed protein product, partial [Thlaspi arvense]